MSHFLMGKLSLILKKCKQFWVSFLCLTLVLPLFMDRFWEISFHWGDWWTINVCTHRPTGDTLGKTAFWNVLCYTSVTLESCSLKVFWSKMVDWLLKVIRWYHDCEILFPIRLAIMFLLRLFEIAWRTDILGETLEWQKTFTTENSNDIFIILQWCSLQWKNDSLVICVVKRRCWMLIP